MIIKKPVLTEKSLLEYKNSKKATFEVDVNTNKIQASQALKDLYGVTISAVKVTNRLGKYKMDRRSRKLNKTKDKKIMTFQLDQKDTIEEFEK